MHLTGKVNTMPSECTCNLSNLCCVTVFSFRTSQSTSAYQLCLIFSSVLFQLLGNLFLTFIVQSTLIIADTFGTCVKSVQLIFTTLLSCPEKDEDCLKLAVSLVKIVYWILIVDTRLLKLCIEVW